MTTASPREQTPSSLALVLVTFLLLSALLLPFYRYELAPDAISYLSIAEQYAAGYAKEAVNAYWGPLYSWCLAALLVLHAPGILAAKVIEIGAGALTLFALHRISLRFDMAEGVRRAFLFVGAAMILGFVMEIDSPDLLFTAVLLLYLGIIFDPAYPSSPFSGVLCGVLGALAYFAKSYGFWFFAAHFFTFNTLHWFSQSNPVRRARILTQFLAGLAVFCAISFVWIMALHAKYGTWMLGTAGTFNHRLVGPQSEGYPHLRRLIPPPTEHALTAWQDPSPSWLPSWTLESRSGLTHQVKLVSRNANRIVGFWIYATPLFAAFLLGYIVLCLDSRARQLEWIYPVSTLVLFSAGYLLITAQDRYFWLPDLLLLWIAFRSLDLLFQKHSVAVSARVVLVWGVVLSFLFEPVLTLHAQFQRDKQLYQWSESIKRSLPVQGRLASCADWQDSAYLAYVLGMPYYGVPAPEPEADEVARDLNPDYRPFASSSNDLDHIPAILSAARIDYFVVWPNCGPLSFGGAQTMAKAGDITVVRLNGGEGSLRR
ncbi:MAG: hypothetical protein WB992_20570 [Bryobacteraceae bacterium]